MTDDTEPAARIELEHDGDSWHVETAEGVYAQVGYLISDDSGNGRLTVKLRSTG